MNAAPPTILRVDAAGLPIRWIPWTEAAELYAAEKVLWSLGGPGFEVRGGHNRVGERSKLVIPPIIATRRVHREMGEPPLTNRALFARDRGLCLYCGERARRLTRDHVMPKAQGGVDVWENVVAACGPCNHAKADRTPEQAGLRLLALPYAPNQAEAMILANRRILADQMDYLSRMVPDRGERWQ